MIVFDVDGTLLGGESYDWTAFEDAFEEAAGFRLTKEFFSNLEEVTAKAIVHQALPELDEEERTVIEYKTRDGYLSRLQDVFQNDPNSFPAVHGVIELLEEIQNRNIPIAIATGDWRPTITLKLKAAKIPFDHLPLVTSCDHYHRHESIASAIKKAGGTLDNAIYVGDGVWTSKPPKNWAFISLVVVQEERGYEMLERSMCWTRLLKRSFGNSLAISLHELSYGMVI